MQSLGLIQDFVQQVVEAIATVIKVDILIFDLNRNIVAGTGEAKCKIGNQFHQGSLTGRLLANGGELLIAREPGHSKECQKCENFGECPHYSAVVAFPVKADNKVIGSFCLVATSPEQRSLMLESEEQLVSFLSKMSDLIGTALNGRIIRNELNILLKRYNHVINSVHEGIIATDSEHNIIHINRSASKLLDLDEQQALGHSIMSLFPSLNLDFENEHLLEVELDYNKYGKGKKKHFLATIVPILNPKKEQMGVNISLRNLSEVHSYASKLMGHFSKYNFQDIKGNSLPLFQIKEKLRKAALTDSTILLRGESGTGKELFAHAVHTASYRSAKNFVAINCSAIPDTLLESELFGYEEGAFTGAKKGGKPGKFELANGGTILLDEIGDMPLILQSKLLRVLENRVIERVGGTEQIPINVRIIAATNRNIEEMVENNEFREDLYYRLGVIPIYIPPLRERREDIPVLINHFLDTLSQRLSRPRQKLDPNAQELLLNYSWPGNIRELQNTIEYAINMNEDEEIITLEHLPNRIVIASRSDIGNNEQPSSIQKVPSQSHNGKLKEMETEAVNQALKRFGTSTQGKENAAKYLGISTATLYRRLKQINNVETI